MALSGSFYNYPVSSFGLYCEWSASQSITGNYSDVTLNVYLSYYTIKVDTRSDSSLQINGSSETYTTPAITDYSSGWKKKFLKSRTVRVYHDGNGNASPSLGASWRFSGTYSGTYINWIETSSTAYLNQIDRTAPTVNISTSAITASGVTVSATASTTCDVWDYSTDNGSSWTNFSNSAATSASKTITGLSPNTSYTIRVRARKKSNQVYGTSGGTTIITLGNAILNSVSTLTADAASPSLAFNWTVYSTGFTYTLDIKNGSTVITTIEIPAQSSTGTMNKTITLTSGQRSAILSAMASVKSFTGSFSLTTKSGSTTIGSVSSRTATIQTTQENSAPTFSNAAGFTYQDSNASTVAVTGNNQIMIQGYSTLVVSAYTATPKNGATITQYQATINDAVISSSGTTLNCGTISKAGNLTLKVTAVDSRGYSVSVSKTITVAEYARVDITDVQMRRVNEVEATTQVELSATLSKILVSGVNKNQFQYLYYRYKKTSESTYNSYSLIPSSNITITDTSVEYENNEFISLDPDYSYNVQFYLLDKLTSEIFTFTLPAGTPLISKRRKKVGINNRNPTSALDVVGEIKQNGIYVLGYVGKVEGDFNNYKDGGIYHYIGTGASNAPGTAGILEVLSFENRFNVIQRFTEW